MLAKSIREDGQEGRDLDCEEPLQLVLLRLVKICLIQRVLANLACGDNVCPKLDIVKVVMPAGGNGIR
jgi:hypothetical protein